MDISESQLIFRSAILIKFLNLISKIKGVFDLPKFKIPFLFLFWFLCFLFKICLEAFVINLNDKILNMPQFLFSNSSTFCKIPKSKKFFGEKWQYIFHKIPRFYIKNKSYKFVLFSIWKKNNNKEPPSKQKDFFKNTKS